MEDQKKPKVIEWNCPECGAVMQSSNPEFVGRLCARCSLVPADEYRERQPGKSEAWGPDRRQRTAHLWTPSLADDRGERV